MKKIILGFILVGFITGCGCNDKVEEEKKQEKENCSNYIETKMLDLGWFRTGNGVMFTNSENHQLAWNLSSNAITYMEGEIIYLFTTQDEIFVGSDFNENRYDELKDETNFEKLKSDVLKIHEDFNTVGCPMIGKETNILEEYKEKFID